MLSIISLKIYNSKKLFKKYREFYNIIHNQIVLIHISKIGLKNTKTKKQKQIEVYVCTNKWLRINKYANGLI